MIRAARMGDIFAITALLVDQQQRSRYAGKVQVDEVYCRRLIGGLVQRNGHTNEGGALVSVIEHDGQIVAFIAANLARVYLIGDMLQAQDLFLVASQKAPQGSVMRLLNGYVAWAEANPLVHEVLLSHTDALPEGARMETIYNRMGFINCGDIYRKQSEEMRVAA